MRKQELDRLREEGLRRYRIIAPLLEEGLAESEKRTIRRLIRSKEGISARSLRRYVAAFKRAGRVREGHFSASPGAGGRTAPGATRS